MCQAFNEAYYVGRDLGFCQALVNEVGGHNPEDSVRHWLELYGALLGPAEQCVSALERLLRAPGLERPVKIQALQALGGMHSLEDRRELGLQNFQRALSECARRPEDTVGKIKCYLWLAHLYKREGTADEYLLKAAALCEGIPEGDLVRGMLDRELADVYRLSGKFREAGEHAENAVDALRPQGFAFELAHALRVWGMLRVYTGDLDEAGSVFEESAELFRRMDPLKQRRYEWVWLSIGLGDVELGRGQFEKAREHYRNAEQKAGDSEFELSVIQGCQAELSAAQRDWDRAIELALASRSVKKNHDDWFGVALTLDIEGRSLCGKGLWAEAAEKLKEGASLSARCHWAYLESRLELSLAETLSRSGAGGCPARRRPRRGTGRPARVFRSPRALAVSTGTARRWSGKLCGSSRTLRCRIEIRGAVQPMAGGLHSHRHPGGNGGIPVS